MSTWGIGRKHERLSDVIHVWLGFISGALGTLGLPIAIVYLIYQSADRLKGEDPSEWAQDLLEFIAGYIVGSMGIRVAWLPE